MLLSAERVGVFRAGGSQQAGQGPSRRYPTLRRRAATAATAALGLAGVAQISAVGVAAAAPAAAIAVPSGSGWPTGCSEDSFLSLTSASGQPGQTVTVGTFDDETVINTNPLDPANPPHNGVTPPNNTFAPQWGITDTSGNNFVAEPAGALGFTVAKNTPITVTIPSGLAPGTHKGWVLAWDSDQNKSGGDCGVAPFTITVNAPTPPVLSITKSASATTVTAGGSFNYTLVATNKGPGDATNAVVTDTIPAGLKVNSTPTSTAGSCTSGTSSSVSCNLGTLTPGASATITVPVTADGTVCGPVNNTGQVSASNASPANSNRVTVTITCPTFNITLTKATSATQVTAGQGFTYTLVATNSGGAAANNVVVKDSIPAKLGISGTPTSTLGSCSVSGNDVTCNLGTLAAANSSGTNSATIRIDVTTTTASCGTVDNVGTVSANGGSTGNSNTVTTTIICPTPGISVTVVKTNNAQDPTGTNFGKTETAAAPSETVTYRAVITNTSLVTEVIGTATDVIAGQPTQNVCGGLLNTILAPGASVTCTFQGTGPASGGGIETDTVTTPVTQQGNPTNTASATDTSTVLPPVLGTVLTPPAPATLAFTGAPVGKLAASAFGMIALGLLLLLGMQLADEPRRLRLRLALAGGRPSRGRSSPGRTDPPSGPGQNVASAVSGYHRTAPAAALTWACDRFRDRFGLLNGPAPPYRR